MSIIQLKNGKHRLQIRRKGFPTVDKVFENRADAEAAEQTALRKQRPSQGNTTLRELWERYADSREYSEKAENTRKTEASRIKPVLAKMGDYSLENLEKDTSLVYDYMDERAKATSPKTKKKLSGTSIRLEVAALSAIVAFGKTRKLVRDNFITHISRPVTKKRRRRVPAEEIGKVKLFTRHSDARIAQAACFVMLVRHLGCRPGELKLLKVKHINLAKRELLFLDTKNGTDRSIHITSDAAQILHLQLAEVPEDCELLFQTRSRKGRWVPYNYAHGVTILKEHKILGSDFIMHAGRREFISRAIESNVPLSTIRKQTGHQSVQALEIYDEGLSTAPEIRAELDRLADKVKNEELMGALSALGLTEEQRAQVNKMLQSEGGWVAPWPESTKSSSK